jgi:hypothetical protein
MGAEFAVPWVGSGSRVLGVWLMVVWVSVGCWRLSFVHAVSRVIHLECLPMLLSVPASSHCDRCFCRLQHAVHSASLLPLAVPFACLRSYPSNGCCTSVSVRTLCPHRACARCISCRGVMAALLVGCVCWVAHVGGLPMLPTRDTQPFFVPDAVFAAWSTNSHSFLNLGLPLCLGLTRDRNIKTE